MSLSDIEEANAPPGLFQVFVSELQTTQFRSAALLPQNPTGTAGRFARGANKSLDTCAYCGCRQSGLMECGGCHTAKYCSPGCQTAHWNASDGFSHEEVCGKC